MANFTAARAYASPATAAATAAGVPVGLLNGLVDHETGGTWNPRSIRQEPQIQDASRGLGQILLRTAQGLGYTGTAEGLFDPATNLRYTALYLADCYRRAGTWPGAVSAYNGGYRPTLGFGSVLVTGRRVVLAYSQTQTGVPIRWYDAAAGQFANQEYVTDVLARAAAFGWNAPAPALDLSALLKPTTKAAVQTTTGAQRIGVGAVLAALALAGLLAALKFLK
jgi:hypothetical protein